jgi:hypothetical protein
MEPLEHLLDPTSRTLWAEYCALETKGMRKLGLQRLEQFITNFQQRPFAEQQLWVEALCSNKLGKAERLAGNYHVHTHDYPVIRHPLFRKIILPVLKIGVAQNDARSYRWIAQFEQYFYADQHATAQLGLEVFDTRFFLRRALQLNPDDSITVELLLHEYARRFDYYVHEVPFGILVQPAIFQTELAEFQELLDCYRLTERWHAALVKWTTLNADWDNYLNHRTEYTGFQHYLSRNV